MYHKKLESDIRCPLEYGLEVFGGKWKSRVICVLADKKTLRYSELRAELVNITDAVLSTTLKALIADDIVSRKSYDEIPPRVEYCRAYVTGQVHFTRKKLTKKRASARSATTSNG